MATAVSTARNAASGPLGGALVVECGQGVSASFAAKLLSQLGAEVIKVEPPQGDVTRTRGPFPEDRPDPNRSGLFMYLNANKLGVTLDLTADADRERFHGLLARADILVHNVLPPDRDGAGLNSGALAKAFPHLIICTISPFGDSGPRANYRAYELNVMHAGGLPSANAAASDPTIAPVKLFGQQADFQGGVNGALAALGAFFYRMKSGRGQVIDLSEQECLAPMIELNWPFYSYAGKEITRLGGRFNPQPADVFECADGKVLMTVYGDHIWRRFVEFLGNPDWARDEKFDDPFGRVHHGEFIRAKVAEWTLQWKVKDLCREMQKLPVPIEPVNTVAEVYDDPHLRERRFFVTMPHRRRTRHPGSRIAIPIDRSKLAGLSARRIWASTMPPFSTPAARCRGHVLKTRSPPLHLPRPARTAARSAGVGFQLGVGRSVRRAATGASGRRRHPGRKFAASVHVPQHAADGRRYPRSQPRRRLQPMEPGQTQHRPGPLQAASRGNHAPVGPPLRRGGGEFCRRLNRAHGPGL